MRQASLGSQPSKAVLALIMALALTAASGSEIASATPPDVSVPELAEADLSTTDRIVVTPAAGRSFAASDAAPTLGIEVLDVLPSRDGRGESVLQLDANLPLAEVDAIAAQLRRSDSVLDAQPDPRVAITVTPNDPEYQQQWGAQLTDMPEAWAFTTGGSPGPIVAVLDTGVNEVSELTGRLLPGYNAIDGSSDTTDAHGHGTMSATVAAAEGNNGLGIAGQCWSCRILPVKALGDSGTGYLSDLVAGIIWAADGGASVINISAGGAVGTPELLDAVKYARSQGAVVVASAGNSGANDALYPARYPEVISVGGARADRTPYEWTNFGSLVDVAAPGCNRAQNSSGSFVWYCGTSSAAPFVSGSVGLRRDLAGDEPAANTEGAVGSTASALGWVNHGHVEPAALLQEVGLGDGEHPKLTPPTLSASSGDLRTNLNWTPATGGDGAYTYAVHRATSGSCTSSSPRLTSTTKRSYVDGTVTHGTTYRYCLYARDSQGEVSGTSNVRTVTASDLSPPKAPILSLESFDLRVVATWTSVSDPTSPVSYRLHRSTTGSCSATSPTLYSGTARRVTDPGLVAGRTYRYCVTARDGAGNVSTPSNVAWTTAGRTVASRPSGAIPVLGDWNGDGNDTPGWFVDGVWYLRNSHSRGPADIVLRYGRPGDTPVVGDFNGNGTDTIGVVRTDPDGRLRFILRYEYRSGADIVMHYGRRGDTPVVGDWNGNGTDTIGVVRTDPDGRLRFILRYEYRSGADIVMHYGRVGDTPVVGDFNGDGTDTLGVRRGRRFILRYVYRSGADIVLSYGRTSDRPIIGDFNGDGRDTLGVVRGDEWILRYVYRSGADYVYRY